MWVFQMKDFFLEFCSFSSLILSYSSGPQLGGAGGFTPQEAKMSRDIFGCHSWAAGLLLALRGQGCCATLCSGQGGPL